MQLLLISGREHDIYGNALTSMHRLRHKVFIQKLKWPKSRKGPIHAVSGMEFDDFDVEEAYYIVHLHESGVVDGCLRMLPTTQPYLLGECYPNLIDGEVPCAVDVWEVSRFAADTSLAPDNILALLLCGMIEFGLALSLRSIISVSDIRIERLIDKAGLKRERLGSTLFTGTDTAAAERYEVSVDAHRALQKYIKVKESVLKRTEILDSNKMAA